MPDDLPNWLLIVVAVVVVFACLLLYRADATCDAHGGVLVRTVSGFRCLKLND